jgi:hypothetical protein
MPLDNFRTIDRKTAYLLPPSVDEWLPERHLARFIVEVIDWLDLSAMSRSYRGTGSASYHPTLLLGLLVYGYATGVFSSGSWSGRRTRFCGGERRGWDEAASLCSDARRQELWVSSEVSGEVHIIDRDKFTIAGKIEFLPPAVQKTAVTPVDHVRCTSDSCRLAATPKSAGSGQNRKFFQAKDRQVIVTNSARFAELRIGRRPQ